MSATIAIHDRLVADAGVTGIVGQRVHPNRKPQQPKYPCIVFARISGTPVSKFVEDVEIEPSRIQLDMYAETYLSVIALRDAVKTSLQRFAGTVSGIIVHHVFIDNELDGRFIDEVTDEATGVFRRIMDLRVWTEE